MPFRPNPVFLLCTQCNYKKVVAPKSDVVPDEYFLQECPQCESPLRRHNLPAGIHFLAKLIGR